MRDNLKDNLIKRLERQVDNSTDKEIMNAVVNSIIKFRDKLLETLKDNEIDNNNLPNLDAIKSNIPILIGLIFNEIFPIDAIHYAFFRLKDDNKPREKFTEILTKEFDTYNLDSEEYFLNVAGSLFNILSAWCLFGIYNKNGVI